MKITITINTDNAAFDLDNAALQQEGSMLEVARILETLARRFSAGNWPMEGPIRDINGNTVGDVRIEEGD
jgi:hypothetical protein